MNQIGHHTSVTVDGLDYLISVRAVEHDKDGTGLLHQAAAAPDMLSTLREIVSQIDRGGSGGKVFARDNCIARARAAIAKAEGRS